ncbi:MAG TPA: family 1 glycosylhydrolase [Pyrinomonadaceae bacterium]|jgi:dTDP-4-dehydrorhamnose reductase
MSQRPHGAKAPELWAGAECTVNRVGDRYFDQLERTGHARRLEDLDLFAWLGVKTVRYPVLWERTAPGELSDADWSWPDERLGRLRELGIRPVVGLVHHGSGPPHTSLTDEAFPEKLAAYARAVAERYPWAEDYTPVNEPLTTARFSGLYGVWYPHGRDARTFIRALFNELRGVVLSMRAVREVNPAARLVQTEDVGFCFSTERLGYQADFENERRWLTFDLLLGRVTREHPLWEYLLLEGVGAGEIEWFAENACAPDLLGIDYYVTSERFLDERVTRYPPHTRGGNQRDQYADVEAVRVRAGGLAGARGILGDVWERYGLPFALTEAHLGCTREEQMRWFHELWTAARDARAEGADVRAVTAWVLFGSFDWDSLITRDAGHYEPGVFDVRSGSPRPTALAHMLRDLAATGAHEHPALDSPGWWRRPDRLLYPSVRGRASRGGGGSKSAGASRKSCGASTGARPLLIAGATGKLGAAFARVAESRALKFRLLSRREMDIADAASVGAALDETCAWAVVNAAGYARVDEAERESETCLRENAAGAYVLAEACARRGLPLLTFSSALVFDGRGRGRPYVESDEAAPLSVYGRSKAEAERRVLEACPSALVVRTGALFGPWDESNFAQAALGALARGEEFVADDDAVITPTYIPEFANVCLDLLIDGERGLWHLANAGAVTWAEFARLAARLAGLDASLVVGRTAREPGLAAPRPAYGALASERGALLKPLGEALECYVRERSCAPVASRGRSAAG